MVPTISTVASRLRSSESSVLACKRQVDKAKSQNSSLALDLSNQWG